MQALPLMFRLSPALSLARKILLSTLLAASSPRAR